MVLLVVAGTVPEAWRTANPSVLQFRIFNESVRLLCILQNPLNENLARPRTVRMKQHNEQAVGYILMPPSGFERASGWADPYPIALDLKNINIDSVSGNHGTSSYCLISFSIDSKTVVILGALDMSTDSIQNLNWRNLNQICLLLMAFPPWGISCYTASLGFCTEQVGSILMSCGLYLEVLSSYLGRDTNYPHSGFSSFPQSFRANVRIMDKIMVLPRKSFLIYYSLPSDLSTPWRLNCWKCRLAVYELNAIPMIWVVMLFCLELRISFSATKYGKNFWISI
jgi:hypothetical protein